MILLVTGDRNWKNYDAIYRELSKYPPDTVVYHGAARGVDTLADIAANKLGFKVRSFPAKWNIYGRSAGPIRNQEMLDRLLDENTQRKVLAFHENISESKGTRDMVSRARGAGIEVEIIKK